VLLAVLLLPGLQTLPMLFLVSQNR